MIQINTMDLITHLYTASFQVVEFLKEFRPQKNYVKTAAFKQFRRKLKGLQLQAHVFGQNSQRHNKLALKGK